MPPRPSGLHRANWIKRSEQWRCLMVAAQSGEGQAYEQLLRELDVWLRRYYARRLPSPAADDARQDALLAIHAKRQAYVPWRPLRTVGRGDRQIQVDRSCPRRHAVCDPAAQRRDADRGSWRGGNQHQSWSKTCCSD